MTLFDVRTSSAAEWMSVMSRSTVESSVDSTRTMCGADAARLSVVIHGTVVPVAAAGDERLFVAHADRIGAPGSAGEFDARLNAGESLRGSSEIVQIDGGECRQLTVALDDPGLVGVLELATGTRHEVDPDVLRGCAEQSVKLIRIRDRRAAAAEQIRLAETARNLVRNASGQRDLFGFFDQCQEPLLEGLRAAATWIEAFDDATDRTEAVFSRRGIDAESITPALRVLGYRAAGQLWDEQRVSITGLDAAPDPILSPEEHALGVEFLASVNAGSAMMVPLGAGDEALGAMVLVRGLDDQPWSRVEIDAALEIGRDLGMAIFTTRAIAHEISVADELRSFQNYRRQLVGTISHDLRNPTTAITGHLSLMEAEPLSEPLPRLVADMDTSARALNATIDDLLLLAQIRNPQRDDRPQPLNILEVAERAIADEEQRRFGDHPPAARLGLICVRQAVMTYGHPDRLHDLVVCAARWAYSATDRRPRSLVISADPTVARITVSCGEGDEPERTGDGAEPGLGRQLMAQLAVEQGGSSVIRHPNATTSVELSLPVVPATHGPQVINSDPAEVKQPDATVTGPEQVEVSMRRGLEHALANAAHAARSFAGVRASQIWRSCAYNGVRPLNEPDLTSRERMQSSLTLDVASTGRLRTRLLSLLDGSAEANGNEMLTDDVGLLPLHDPNGVVRYVWVTQVAPGSIEDTTLVSRLRDLGSSIQHALGEAYDYRRFEERLRLALAARNVVRVASKHLDVQTILDECHEPIVQGLSGQVLFSRVYPTPGWAEAGVGYPEEIPRHLPHLLEGVRRTAGDLWGLQRVAQVVADPALVEGTPGALEKFDELSFEAEDLATIRGQMRAFGMSYALLIPIGAGDRTLGHLLIARGSENASPWQPQTLAVAAEIGRDLGRALTTVRLFNQERSFVDELRLLGDYKDDILSAACTSLKQPLRQIAEVSAALRAIDDLPPQVVRSMRVIDRAAARMGGLADDLTAMSHVGDPRSEPDLKPMDLRALVDEGLTVNSVGIANLGLRVTVEQAPDTLVHGDAGELHHVINNLLDNAVKYNTAGGALEVTIERIDQDTVRLSVRDEGIGIAVDEQPKVFSEFFRSASEEARIRPGTGLGLAIVARIVRRHHGSIVLESAIGQGSTFRVTLPAASDS